MITQWTDINTLQWVSSEDYSFITDYDSVFTYSFIFNDGTYAYSSYDNILDIYDMSSQAKLNSIYYDYYITSIFANDNNIFLGAKDEGVYSINKSVLSNFYSNEDIYNSTNLYKEYPSITSNQINFIHGNNDCVSFCTSSGVDFFKFEPNGYRSYTTCSGIQQSFLLSERELYYTVSGTEGWSIHEANPITNWDTTTALISNTSYSFLSRINNVNVFKVSTYNNEKVFFLATDLGVLIIDYTNNDYIVIE